MALTMTRTRTQTALTKMATLLANLNGELEFVRALLQQAEPDHRAALAAREATLQQKREAVVAALRQFDSSIDPEAVGTAEGWRAHHKGRTLSAIKIRYLVQLKIDRKSASC